MWHEGHYRHRYVHRHERQAGQLPYFELAYGIYTGGCDIPDGSGEEAQFDAYRPKASGEGDYATMAWAMRNAAKRVCYSIAHSNAMNGIAKGTVMVPVTLGGLRLCR